MSDEAIDLSSLAGGEEAEEVRDGEPITKEDLELLMAQQQQQEAPADLVAACAGGLKVNTVPAVIVLESGSEFIVDNFRAWGYCPYGVFAIGRFSDAEEDVEEYRVFNGDKVNNILIQWAVFEEEVKAQQAAAEEAAETADEEASE